MEAKRLSRRGGAKLQTYTPQLPRDALGPTCQPKHVYPSGDGQLCVNLVRIQPPVTWSNIHPGVATKVFYRCG